MLFIIAGVGVGVDPRIGVIFVGPYITWLIWRMGLREGTSSMRIEGNSAPITIDNFRAMRKV